jgi:hypothetical protein
MSSPFSFLADKFVCFIVIGTGTRFFSLCLEVRIFILQIYVIIKLHSVVSDNRKR